MRTPLSKLRRLCAYQLQAYHSVAQSTTVKVSPQTFFCSGPPCPPWSFKPFSSCSRLRSALHRTAAAVVLLAAPLCAARRCLLACWDSLSRPTKFLVWFLLERLQHLCRSCCAASAGLACQVCRALAVCCSVLLPSFARARTRLADLTTPLYPLDLLVFLT